MEMYLLLSVVIWGGDLNVCLDPRLHHFADSEGRGKQAALILNELMEAEGLIDIWRSRNPEVQEGTFVSTVH